MTIRGLSNGRRKRNPLPEWNIPYRLTTRKKFDRYSEHFDEHETVRRDDYLRGD